MSEIANTAPYNVLLYGQPESISVITQQNQLKMNGDDVAPVGSIAIKTTGNWYIIYPPMISQGSDVYTATKFAPD